jgi:hypothetical protein
VGFNTALPPAKQAESQMAALETNRLILCVWLSSAGINGSQWSSWSSHHLAYDGYLPGVSLDIAHTFPGSDVSFRLDRQNPCLFADYAQGGIPVTPRTTYQVSVRLRLEGVAGPADAGDYGFVVKQASWLDKDCVQPGRGTRLIGPVTGTTGWMELDGTYTTASGMYWLDNLYLVLENTTAGAAYIDEVTPVAPMISQGKPAEASRQPHIL